MFPKMEGFQPVPLVSEVDDIGNIPYQVNPREGTGGALLLSLGVTTLPKGQGLRTHIIDVTPAGCDKYMPHGNK